MKGEANMSENYNDKNIKKILESEKEELLLISENSRNP